MINNIPRRNSLSRTLQVEQWRVDIPKAASTWKSLLYSMSRVSMHVPDATAMHNAGLVFCRTSALRSLSRRGNVHLELMLGFIYSASLSLLSALASSSMVSMPRSFSAFCRVVSKHPEFRSRLRVTYTEARFVLLEQRLTLVGLCRTPQVFLSLCQSVMESRWWPTHLAYSRCTTSGSSYHSACAAVSGCR